MQINQTDRKAAVLLFCFSGICYNLLELCWRGRTHWTMTLLGGVCFYAIGQIKKLPLRFSFRCVFGAVFVTVAEFFCGIVCNLWLRWQIWDYSNMPLNVLGQICLPFSALWLLISALAMPLYDLLQRQMVSCQKLLDKPNITQRKAACAQVIQETGVCRKREV